MKSPMTQEQRYIKNDRNPDLPADPESGDPNDHSMLVTSIYNMADTFLRELDQHQCIGGRRRQLFADGDDPGTWIYARNGKRKLSIAGPWKQG